MKILRWLNTFAIIAMLLSVLPVQAAAPAAPDNQPAQQEREEDDPLRRLQDATGGAVRVSTSSATRAASFVSLPAGSLPAFKMSRLDNAGTYRVTASAFGYSPASASDVVVAEGAPTTQDFALTQMLATTLSGVVRDSATNWPLYASIVIDSAAGRATLWTNPETGAYSVDVPTDEPFTLTVAAWVAGYTPETLEMQLPGAATQNFALDADLATCNAPGYQSGRTLLLSETFESWPLPAGWNIPDYDPVYGSTWRASNAAGEAADPDPNRTGGTGLYADADSYWWETTMDTQMQTPVQDLTGYTDGEIVFKSDMAQTSSTEWDVDLSLDGGATWPINLLHRAGQSYRGPETITLTLTGAGNQNNVRVRFRYQGDNDYWWQVDDVFVYGIIACVAPTTGGLVVGNVYNASTGDDGLNAATVSGAGDSTTTVATPDDPNVADGFYTLYSPAGSQTFTAAKAPYTPDSATVNVTAGDTQRVDFTLAAPVLGYAPDTFSVWLSAGQQTIETLTLSNTGSAAMNWGVDKFGIPGGALSNGPLVTHPGGGSGGADASAVQTALGLTSYGFNHSVASRIRIADDFTLPGGGQIDTIVFYAYQTGSSTTSTITQVNLRIWRGRPGDAGSTVIWGDTTTNRMASTIWSNIYRVFDTDMTDTTRPIMATTVNVEVLLEPGTYWLDWQSAGTPTFTGPWAPLVSILGQTTTGNARWFDDSSWQDVLDGVFPQGFPFVLNGPAPAPWLILTPASGSLAQGANTSVNFTLDSTGLASGIYNSSIGITSTDLLRSGVLVPVQLTVEANYASIATGNWSGSAWVSGSPSASDWVTITTGHTVTVDSAAAHCHNLYVEAGGTLVIPEGNQLTVEGEVQNNGTLRQTQDVAASGLTRFLNLQNQAGTASAYYGVDITPSAGSGSTTVEVRGNQAACTQNGGAGDTALLKRCFKIDTAVTNATVRFWYTAPELNGQAPDALRLWHYDGANAWTEVGSGDYGYSGAVCTDDCWVERGGISTFSPFTVGGTTAPTAITLAAVAAQNGVYIVWGLALLGLGLVFVLRRRKS